MNSQISQQSLKASVQSTSVSGQTRSPQLSGQVSFGGGVATPVDPFFTATLTDFSDADYYYYGGNINNGWKINRFAKNGLTKTVATQSSNSSYSTLEAAWIVRSELTYLVE